MGKVEETNDDHEENDEEEELIEELGGAIGDLVEDREDPEVEEIESNEKEEDDVIIDEDTTPAIKETSARGGRGRGANLHVGQEVVEVLKIIDPYKSDWTIS